MNEATPTKHRRRPQQQRSKETVEAIVTATAHVLVAEGYPKLTTNRVAKAAGVSVGSLYQYFPNKRSLVIALIQRHIEFAIELVQSTSVELADAPVDVAVRAFVRSIVEIHAEEPELHPIITQLAMQLGLEHVVDHHTRLRQMVELYLGQHADELRPKNLALAAFMLVNIVESTLHSALLIDPVAWSDDELEQEIGDAVIRYLGITET